VISTRGLIVTPEINRRRAVFVLGRIDEILSWERTKEQEKDVRFVELGEYLCEVRAKLIPKHELQQVGWSKATELVKVARRDGEEFDCATWLHKAKEMPQDGFKVAVKRHLTGKETEPWEIIYFKLFRSQLPVVEKALETAGQMLGTDTSRGYCLK
jgi:hypothetical protein